MIFFIKELGFLRHPAASLRLTFNFQYQASLAKDY